MPAVINPIARANVNAQLADTTAHGSGIPEIARLNLPKANSDSDLGDPITHSFQPFREWFAAAYSLVSEQFDRSSIVAYKLLRGHQLFRRVITT